MVCRPLVSDLRYRDEEPDPGVHQSEKSDPDPHQSEKPDPHQRYVHLRYITVKTKALCRLHTAFLHWPLSSAATKKVQGPDTT
jgi:hypothetical protein